MASGGALSREALAVPVLPTLDDALGTVLGTLRERPLRTLCVEDAAHLYPLPPRESSDAP